MRPLRSFSLLLIFLVVLTGLNYAIPATGIFPSINEFIPDLLIRALTPGKSQEDSKPAQQIIYVPAVDVPDTLLFHLDADTVETASEKTDPLNQFLDSLRYSNRQVRIMYYGDSQIEGDRITSYLRQTLRKGHGGTGPGLLLPLMPVMSTKTVWIKSSSNWKKYNYLSYSTGKLSHSDLGPFMAVCRFLPDGRKTLVPEKAYVRIRPSNIADSSVSEYDYLRIFYGNTSGLVRVSVRSDDNEIFCDTLRTGYGFHETGCTLGRVKEITVEFEGTVSPDIYGLSIESKTGIIVDNIPQRGSAGLEFTMVGKANLAETYRILKPDLFILHYGLNIVKNVRHDYSYFQKGLKRQLELLKEISPATPALVMSVTDMADIRGDSIRSYINIPSIIDAQYHAATDAGAAFWDAYRSMGGESSIIRWAARNPPLAQKDYVHFTYSGADTLSKIMADALFAEKAAVTSGINGGTFKLDTIIRSEPLSASEYSAVAEDKDFFSLLISDIFRYDPDKPMIFTTAAFWLFLLLVLAGYSLVYRKLALRNLYLFLISMFFYYKAGGLFLLILIFVTVVDFTCGILMVRSKSVAGKRFVVLLSLISNLGLLGYFKYTGFIVSTINDLFGTHFRVYDLLSAFSNSVLGTSFDISSIILPVGISFFTFQSLSYIIDLYRGKLEPVRNIIDFGFYVSFFPHLVAGPIVRASIFMPQIYQEFRLSRHEFSHALFMISKGLIKKVIISNFIAINLVDRVFDGPALYSGFENLMAVYGYGLQIYCDFSGYTDIAIGVALILGFRLPINFYSPYKAESLKDFWKRWHISLSQWLRDYLYIPLGGNRKGRLRTYINVMITMLLGGLWHGASLKYIIWGGLHGTGLVINKIWDSLFKGRFKTGWAGRALSLFVTFQFVNFCWIFFRAPDIGSVNIMLKQIFENFSPGSYLSVLPAYSSAFMLMAAGYAIHFLPEKVKESYRGLFITIPIAAQLAVVLVVAVLLFQMRSTEVIPFIYFRF
jgi:D-alanyl-lipoteichoic acid acyltransferase DltB (MBOAT superfamily)